MGKIGKMPVHVAQIGCLNKIVYATHLLDELKQQHNGKPCDFEQFSKWDTQAESYRMLIANYLIALVGHTGNDRISIHNNPIKGKEKQIADFYNKHRDNISKLYDWRNKVYSHLDPDFADNVGKTSPDFINDCVNDLIDILDYAAHMRPKA